MSNRESNPVLQDFVVKWWGRTSTLSTTASRRLALMSYTQDEKGNEIFVTCAEPPPDVGETFAKAFAAQLELKTAKGIAGADANVSTGIDSRVATAIAPMISRTQGLQILRDSAYTLCVDRMNGWIKNDEYVKMKNERFTQSMELIKLELANMPDRGSQLQAPTLATSALPTSKPPVAAPTSAASAP